MESLRRAFLITLIAAATAAAGLAQAPPPPPPWAGKPWMRHTIDNTSRGADGVKLIDINTDGRPDVTTGWEEGGLVRVYYTKAAWECAVPGRRSRSVTYDRPRMRSWLISTATSRSTW